MVRRQAGRDDDPRQPTIYTGTLSRDGLSVPIRFQLRFGMDGDLRFRVFPVPLTREALDLRSAVDEKSGTIPRYTVDAVSKAGTRFVSDDIIVSKSGTTTKPTSAWVTFGFKYASATFGSPRNESAEKPVVRHSLRGFECFAQIRTNTPLGELIMHGTYPAKRDTRVSGYMMMRAPDDVADAIVWRRDAERLFEHVRDLMSLALSHPVTAPIQDFWIEDRWERRAFSQTKSRRNAQHVLHPMLLQDYLDTATRAFFHPPISVKNLGYTIEWFSKVETYSEMRLTNVMTALENLIDSNLSEDDQFFLPEKGFDGVKRSLRHAVRDELIRQSEADASLDNKAIGELISALPAKVQDLNRRTFGSKVRLLAERWNVPLHDLPSDGIKKAVAARNLIVHRGYYYEPHTAAPVRGLWDHILVMREILIRFVLTAVGYSGTYLSFRGGQHDVQFPPVLDQLADAPAEPT